MPTHDHQLFLPQAIDSVRGQTYGNWELIIVDDGSSDGTWDIARAYAAKDERIRAYTQRRKGVWGLADTYNFAFNKCDGELVAVLEGDDYWPADKLSRQVSTHAQIPDLLLCYGKVAIVRNGRPVGWYRHPTDFGVCPSTRFLRLALLRSSALMSISIVVRRKALEAISGFQQRSGYPAVDFPTWLAVVALPGRVAFLDETLGYWRHYDGQVTHALGVEMAEAGQRIALDFFEDLDCTTKTTLGVAAADIARRSRTLIADAYLGRVRSALLQQDDELLRASLPGLWLHGGRIRRLQAVYALAASKRGWNMERILEIGTWVGR